MRDDSPDSVTPGGVPAPLGPRGAPGTRPARAGGEAAGEAAREAARGARGPEGGAADRSPPTGRLPAPRPDDEASPLRVGGSTRLLLVLLAAGLAAYSLIAVDVVHGGPLSEADQDVASWIAREMPAWAEWTARPFTWLGAMVGMTIVVVAAAAWLLLRGARAETGLLVAATIGIQIVVVAGKNGYERPRPDYGSPIDVPSSFSFPSGHAANGIAVFGLLGLIVAAHARTTRARTAAVVAGFAVGALSGASRVVLDVHYVTDVVAGAFLGLAWLALCILVARALDRHLRARAG